MRWAILGYLALGLLSSAVNCDEALNDLADEFLAAYSDAVAEQNYLSVLASWTHSTNLTESNGAKVTARSLVHANFTQYWGQKAKQLFSNEALDDLNSYRSRQLRSIKTLGTANLSEEKQKEVNEITTRLYEAYSRSCVTLSDEQCHPLNPDLTEMMGSIRDYDQLKYLWQGWYDTTGRPIKDDYEKFVALYNEAFAMDDYADAGEYRRSWYETTDFEQVVEELWNEVKPLYLQLHAYVRRKLFDTYGAQYINLKGPIPAHLLGNMWGQTWGNIYDLVEAFPGRMSVDATPAMVEQGYDALRMYKVSEEFFTSLGLEPMPEEFWANSMIVKPQDGRNVACHASAWDFYNGDDFRIKMCTLVNMEDLTIVHHEMGHIQYFLQYKHQPIPYRAGANPGFHEAVGDTLALSVSTPAHLYKIGLLPSVEQDEEADINFLLRQALDKVAFLPFAFLVDKWRWSVFDGSTPKARYQQKWDELRLEYQGIVPPVSRDDPLNFDPGAKYHISSDTPYIRYFVSQVIQFQFYKAMCDASGHSGPLYKCDFYQSTEAGERMANMLKLGSSEVWPIAMEALTGSPDMSTLPLQEYFQPLTDWLAYQNAVNGEVIGWEEEMNWRPI